MYKYIIFFGVMSKNIIREAKHYVVGNWELGRRGQELGVGAKEYGVGTGALGFVFNMWCWVLDIGGWIWAQLKVPLPFVPGLTLGQGTLQYRLIVPRGIGGFWAKQCGIFGFRIGIGRDLLGESVVFVRDRVVFRIYIRMVVCGRVLLLM